MAKGPRYKTSFRRRYDGKTDYHKRLKLLKSRKLRVVIRASNDHIRVQIGNIPAAYLTGYLAGLRAKTKNIQDAIFDLGIFYHRNRVLAACKGIIDTGMIIPYREEFFPEELKERIKGTHIENYAKNLKSNEPEKYEQIFSGYLKKQKLNPLKISQMFSDSLKQIENKT